MTERVIVLVLQIYLCHSVEFKQCRYIQSGPDERSIPGNTIAVQADMPFSGLTTFGGSFLSKFECSQMPHAVSYKSEILNYIFCHHTAEPLLNVCEHILSRVV